MLKFVDDGGSILKWHMREDFHWSFIFHEVLMPKLVMTMKDGNISFFIVLIVMTMVLVLINALSKVIAVLMRIH